MNLHEIKPKWLMLNILKSFYPYAKFKITKPNILVLYSWYGHQMLKPSSK